MTYEDLNKQLNNFCAMANRACEEAKQKPHQFGGDIINWKNLSCIETCYCLLPDGNRAYRITISEADPRNIKLPRFIETYFELQGLPNIKCLCEW